MMPLIVAYYIDEAKGKITISRCASGVVEDYTTDNFDEAVDFITEQFPYSLHICWSLYHFSDILFSLLPRSKQKQLEKTGRVFYHNTKIFNTERVLGLTVTHNLQGNFVSKLENNIYSISHWMPQDTQMPSSAIGIEELGDKLLTGLDKLGIYPTKLTSPIGLYADTLDAETLPTIYNFPSKYLEAMNYADQMARYEWRTKYKNTKKGFHYDLTSAYPYFISQLPDTRHGTISNRRKETTEWGIVKGQFKSLVGGRILPIDKNAKYFTTDEIDWIEKYHLGTFTIENGYYFTFNGGRPYEPIVNRLLEARQTDDIMAATIAKKIAQGLSGYLDQYNKDHTLGEYYNPILAAMVRSRCRLAVADFIVENDLVDSLVAVTVDGVVATKKLDLPNKSKAGEWRKDEN